MFLKIKFGDFSVSAMCCYVALCLYGNICPVCTCMHMPIDITTAEATLPKGKEGETENLTLGHQNVPTMLYPEKTTAQGAKAVYIIILINLFLFVSLVLL